MAVAHSTLGAASSDAALIQLVIDGDHEAFEVLYDRYFRRVYAYVDRRLHNRADTEETVQEVFINIFSSLPSYRGEAVFAAWVLGVARRTIASRFKKKRPVTVSFGVEEDGERFDIDHPSLQAEATPHEHYECRERVRRIQRAARRLTPEQCRLVELHHLMNHSIQDLAVSLQKSEDAIKSNLYRARKLLLAR